MSSRISGGQQRCDWYIIPDVPTTLALLTADGSDWSSPPRVLVGPLGSDGIIDLVVPEITATIDGVDGSLARATLDDTAMDAILAAYPLVERDRDAHIASHHPGWQPTPAEMHVSSWPAL